MNILHLIIQTFDANLTPSERYSARGTPKFFNYNIMRIMTTAWGGGIIESSPSHPMQVHKLDQDPCTVAWSRFQLSKLISRQYPARPAAPKLPLKTTPASETHPLTLLGEIKFECTPLSRRVYVGARAIPGKIARDLEVVDAIKAISPDSAKSRKIESRRDTVPELYVDVKTCIKTLLNLWYKQSKTSVGLKVSDWKNYSNGFDALLNCLRWISDWNI